MASASLLQDAGDTWHDAIQFTGEIDDSPHQIGNERVFIGSCMAEQNRTKLEKAGITHVLQVAEGLRPSHTELSYLRIPLQDHPGEDCVVHFAKAFSFIDKALQDNPSAGVLVHCVAGVSRSATFVMGWLMARRQLSYEDAFMQVIDARPLCMPNYGFRQQLQRYYQSGCNTDQWLAWRHVFQKTPSAATVSLAGLVPPHLRSAADVASVPQDVDA